jgi:hypothetical protein
MGHFQKIKSESISFKSEQGISDKIIALFSNPLYGFLIGVSVVSVFF